jgi:hypothetical protein
MKLTLNDVMKRINQILNYPSVSYDDISHFFDHAIAELNTVLKTGIPSVSEMVTDNTLDVSAQDNTILFDTAPTNPVTGVDNIPVGNQDSLQFIYCKANDKRGFYVWTGTEWKAYGTVYGILFNSNGRTAYVLTPVGQNAYWVESPVIRRLEFDLCDY